MKKIGLGIAILLFAIIIALYSSGMGVLVIGTGIVGLILSIIGFMERKQNNFEFVDLICLAFLSAAANKCPLLPIACGQAEHVLYLLSV